MMSSQPMKNSIPGIQPIREFLHVLCAVGTTKEQTPEFHRVTARGYIRVVGSSFTHYG